MVWSDRKLRKMLLSQDDYLQKIGPASIDLRLGPAIRVARWWWKNPLTRRLAWYACPQRRNDQAFYWTPPRNFKTFTLWPGEFVLCHSLETTTIPDDAIALLFSKSSTGRKGLEHLHAGYGDPGFSGQWTWELHNVAHWPIELVAGAWLMQVAIIGMTDKPERLYAETGRYQGQTGPTVAR